MLLTATLLMVTLGVIVASRVGLVYGIPQSVVLLPGDTINPYQPSRLLYFHGRVNACVDFAAAAAAIDSTGIK